MWSKIVKYSHETRSSALKLPSCRLAEQPGLPTLKSQRYSLKGPGAYVIYY